LSEDLELNTAATLKLQDMFQKQYFAHLSPSGEGAGDFVKEVGYEFIIIGENLALGNFRDDQALVQAWIDSSGHRKNILNECYSEIGVAVDKGMFEGKETWLAVQIFGLPLAACPLPDENLKTKIEVYEDQLEKLQKTIESLEAEIEVMYPKRGAAYNQKVRQYNNLVTQYNNLVKETKKIILDYNTQVELFNECAAGE